MSTQKLSLFLLSVLIAVQFSSQRINVLSPDMFSAENHFYNNKIEYVIAHFGDVEYGGSLVGFVHNLDKSNGTDGCTEIKHIDPFTEDDNQPILIAERGGCEFYTKALNAQYAGAKLLIVINNTDQLDFYPVAYDKKALEIKIPTLVIKKRDGGELKRLLTHEDKNIAENVILDFMLPLPEKDVVHMKLILTAVDKDAYQFMYDFKNHMVSLGENFKFEPVFYWDEYKVSEDTATDDEIKKNYCANGNTNFCLLDVDYPMATIGSQTFQMCLWPVMDQTEFFDFAKLYLESCLIGQNYYQEKLTYSGEYGAKCQCPNGQFYNVGSKGSDCTTASCNGGTVAECYGKKSKSWANKGVYCASGSKGDKWEHLYSCAQDVSVFFGHRKRRTANTCNDNAFTDSEKLKHHYAIVEEKIRNAGIYSHPTLMVNGKPVWGTLNAESAFNAACEAFIDPPSTCSYVTDKWVYNERVNELVRLHASHETHFWIFNTVLFFVIFGIAGTVFYVVFKKMYKNVLSTQIDQMVSDSVSKYNRMPDQNETNIMREMD